MIAAGLGSDVPFFLTGGLALGVGRGDEVYPLPDLPPLAVVVAVPQLEVATAEVYRRLEPRLTWVGGEASVVAFAAGLVRAPRWERMTNDLEAVVVAGWPPVAEVVSRLRRTAPLRAAVTGSGAAAFALFSDAAAARAAAATLDRGWRVHVGVTLARAAATLVAVEVGADGDRRGR